VWRRTERESEVGPSAAAERNGQVPSTKDQNENREPRTENREPRTENREPRTENREPRGTECGRPSEFYARAATQGFTRKVALTGKVMLAVTNDENRAPEEPRTGSGGSAARAGAG
jgi:hypothetical protein